MSIAALGTPVVPLVNSIHATSSTDCDCASALVDAGLACSAKELLIGPVVGTGIIERNNGSEAGNRLVLCAKRVSQSVEQHSFTDHDRNLGAAQLLNPLLRMEPIVEWNGDHRGARDAIEALDVPDAVLGEDRDTLTALGERRERRSQPRDAARQLGERRRFCSTHHRSDLGRSGGGRIEKCVEEPSAIPGRPTRCLNRPI